MKRFVTALAICAALMAGLGAYADDYPWDGDTNTKWETGTNWTGGGFPGAGSPARVIDRALHNADTNNPLILFDGSSGTGNCGCRTVVEFFMDADAATEALTLRVNGGTLNIEQFFMKSGGQTSETATLDVDDGELHIRVLDITGNATNPAALEIDADLVIAGETHITGVVDVTMNASGGDAVLDFGRLIISNGKIE